VLAYDNIVSNSGDLQIFETAPLKFT